MKTIRQLRQQFLIAIGVLTAICLICAVYILMPTGRGSQQKDAAVQSARAALHNEETQIMPLRGLDQKLTQSKQNIAAFYQNKLPDRYSAISQTLNDLANKHRVRLSGVTYKSDSADIGDVQQVTMRATLNGDYENVMRYIDAVDHSNLFFLLDNVGVTSEQNGQIQLQLTLDTFLRATEGQAGPTA